MTKLADRLEQLAGLATGLPPGVDRANAKGMLAAVVCNNLPAILAALRKEADNG
jgi:hypothetical protein